MSEIDEAGELYRLLLSERKLRIVLKSASSALVGRIASILTVIEHEKRVEEDAEAEMRERKKARGKVILAEMRAEGVKLEDVIESFYNHNPEKRKIPIRYEYIDAQGVRHGWSGRGRMPVIIRDAIAAGATLDNFAVDSTSDK